MHNPTYRGVLPAKVASGELWPQISALLERSLPYGRGEYELGDIRAGVADGQLLAVARVECGTVRFVVVCSLVIYPRKRVLYIQQGAGEQGVDLADTVRRVATELECDWVETRTRESVARLYRRAGFDIGYCVPILEVK